MANAKAVALLTLLSLLTLPAAGQIYNWNTGTVIPGTEGFTPGPGVNLVGWNQTNHSLRYADLSGGLDLYGSQFDLSWLDYAHFGGANLARASFWEAELSSADLSGANLTNAYFEQATLTGANLSGATVTGTDFNYTTSYGFAKEQLYSTAGYQAGNLSGIGLGHNDLTDWNLANQSLTAACFEFSTLAGANLGGANATGAEFRYATLTGANLSGTNLAGADFEGATLTDADLSGATVSGTNFGYTTSKGFTKEQLYATASYQTGSLSSIALAANDLSSWNLANQNLSNAYLPSATLTNANLSGADLTDADLKNTVLTGTALSGANLAGANLNGAMLTGTDLSAAIVAGAGFCDTTSNGFTKEQLYSTVSYHTGDLSGIGLGGNNDLSGWNLSNQDLTNAYFEFATLTGANLSGANLAHAGLQYAWLTSAGLTGANLVDADLRDATLTGAAVDGTNLTGANFVGARLTNADFSDATVIGADFGGTTQRGFTKEQLYSTASYQAGDLRGIGMGSDNLSAWNLSSQNLTTADFRYATLTGTDLSNANLSGADFEHATLTGAILSGATVARADFSYTTSTGFTKTQLYSTTSYQAGNLRGIQLCGNDLTGWNLADQNMTGAFLASATLTGADLSGTNLTSAWFGNVKLTDTDLSRADMRGAHNLYASELVSAITENLIRPGGHIAGLDLGVGETLKVRDYDGGIAITVDDAFRLDPAATLELLFADAEWGSTISLTAGLVADLDGTLRLEFEPNADVESLVGTTFDLFHWNGGLPRGATFGDVVWPTWATWDISDLYIGGTATLVGVPEPASAGLVVIGMLVAIRRRRVG